MEQINRQKAFPLPGTTWIGGNGPRTERPLDGSRPFAPTQVSASWPQAHSGPVGWKCPGCGACYAPGFPQCTHCTGRGETPKAIRPEISYEVSLDKCELQITKGHRYAFRQGEPAQVISAALVTPLGKEPRLCWQVEFRDGVRDHWPMAETRLGELAVAGAAPIADLIRLIEEMPTCFEGDAYTGFIGGESTAADFKRQVLRKIRALDAHA